MVVSAICNARSATGVSCRVNRFHRRGLCPGTRQFLARQPGSRSDDIFVPLWAALPLTSGQECPRSLQKLKCAPRPPTGHTARPLLQEFRSGVADLHSRLCQRGIAEPVRGSAPSMGSNLRCSVREADVIHVVLVPRLAMDRVRGAGGPLGAGIVGGVLVIELFQALAFPLDTLGMSIEE